MLNLNLSKLLPILLLSFNTMQSAEAAGDEALPVARTLAPVVVSERHVSPSSAFLADILIPVGDHFFWLKAAFPELSAKRPIGRTTCCLGKAESKRLVSDYERHTGHPVKFKYMLVSRDDHGNAALHASCNTDEVVQAELQVIKYRDPSKDFIITAAIDERVNDLTPECDRVHCENSHNRFCRCHPRSRR